MNRNWNWDWNICIIGIYIDVLSSLLYLSDWLHDWDWLVLNWRISNNLLDHSLLLWRSHKNWWLINNLLRSYCSNFIDSTSVLKARSNELSSIFCKNWSVVDSYRRIYKYWWFINKKWSLIKISINSYNIGSINCIGIDSINCINFWWTQRKVWWLLLVNKYCRNIRWSLNVHEMILRLLESWNDYTWIYWVIPLCLSTIELLIILAIEYCLIIDLTLLISLSNWLVNSLGSTYFFNAI